VRLRPRSPTRCCCPSSRPTASWRTCSARQPGAPLSEKDCVQQSLAYGRQAYLQRRISSEASIGKLFFSNGYKLLDNYGLFGAVAKDPALAERRLQVAQTLPRPAAAYRARARDGTALNRRPGTVPRH
jgi:hypothetical protein